jgi:predicted TIM-barrel fold metal-dependent hydrolase
MTGSRARAARREESMSDAPRMISADSHVVEPPDLWTERIDKRFRARAPRVVSNAGGMKGDSFVCEELPPIPVASVAVAGVDESEYKERMFAGYAGVPRGAFDPIARLADQDRDGVAAEVLYTSVAMAMYGLADGELRAAIFRAYNDWLAEFCAAAPSRYAGIALIPMDDVGVGVAEIARVARLGLRGGMIWGEPPAERPYDSSDWDPLWAAAQDARFPLSLHILTGRGGTGVKFNSIMRGYGTLHHGIERSLIDLIFGGVLQRFPRLRIVSAENDIGWMPHFLQRIDHAWEKYRSLEPGAYIPEPPSSYFRRNVFATFQHDAVGVRERAEIGVDNLMWASDFPHSDSTWPRSREFVARDFAGVPPAELRRMVCDNAAQLYGLA